MAHGRIVIGGPSNSGKSAFAVILRACLNNAGVHTFHQDYDPFSPTREYALKKISDNDRKSLKKIITKDDAKKLAKKFSDLGSKYDLVIGDLPGTTNETTKILATGGTHAIILCSDKKTSELKDWINLFVKLKIPIICILESNLNGSEEIIDGSTIRGKLSNLDRNKIPPPPYSKSMNTLSILIGNYFK